MVSSRSSILIWANVAAFIAMVLVNGLAGSTTIIGGQATADVSDANQTLITPAGYTFAIWGIIYFLLGLYVVYQSLPSKRSEPFHERIGWLFVLSSLMNILWLFAWQYEQLAISVVLMFLLLASLIMIYLRLDIGRTKVGWGERLAVHLPFSTYFGWITIASIANVAATLVSVQWDGFGMEAETWAVIIIMIALILASLVAWTRRDIAYSLVIIWAFIGISASSASQTVVDLILISAAVIAIVLVTGILLSRIRPAAKGVS